MKKIKLSILVGVSMLLLMPNVASAQNNSVGESVSSQSSCLPCLASTSKSKS